MLLHLHFTIFAVHFLHPFFGILLRTFFALATHCKWSFALFTYLAKAFAHLVALLYLPKLGLANGGMQRWRRSTALFIFVGVYVWVHSLLYFRE